MSNHEPKSSIVKEGIARPLLNAEGIGFVENLWARVEGLLTEPGRALGTRAAIEADWLPDDWSQYCWRCGASVGHGAVSDKGCAHCVGTRLRWDRVFRLDAYHGPLVGWIRAMKFEGAWGWARWMGHVQAEMIYRHVMAINDEPGPVELEREQVQLTRILKASEIGTWLLEPRDSVVCWTPLHWRRRWERGYDQSRVMANALADKLGLSVVSALKRTRATERQSRLPPAQRKGNMREAFEALDLDLTGKHVFLVDDVKTTGETAGACIQVLRELGASSVSLVVACVRDPRTVYLNEDPAVGWQA